MTFWHDLERPYCGIGHVGITQVDSAAETLKAVDTGSIDLVVVGQTLADTSPVDCVTRLVRRNAMINCAMISAMEQDAFHEATEGLGILMQLPPNPSSDDATVLFDEIQNPCRRFSAVKPEKEHSNDHQHRKRQGRHRQDDGLHQSGDKSRRRLYAPRL